MVFGKMLTCPVCQKRVYARPTRRTYTDMGGRTWALYRCELGRHYIKELTEDAKKERVKET